MFGLWAKVLFYRQMYGLKGRWVMVLCSLLYTAFFVGQLTLGRVVEKNEEPRPRPGPPPGPSPRPPPSPGPTAPPNREFGETDAPFWNPSVIVATPRNAQTQQLLAGAYSILKRGAPDASIFNVHVSFAENKKQMALTLGKSVWPSFGIEFQEVNNTKLEYTVVRAVDPRMFTFSSRLSPVFTWTHPIHRAHPSIVTEQSHGLLQLQAAIDSAYIQAHFPDSRHLTVRSFPDLSDKENGGILNSCGPKLGGTTFATSLSVILLMVTFATFIVREKASGIRELLCVNGLPRWMANSGWLFCFAVLGLITALLQWALLVIPLDNPSTPKVSIPLVLLCLIIYGWTALALASFVASLFSSQVLTILLIIIYWLVSAILALVNIFFDDDIDTLYAAQCFISIAPNFGFFMFMRVAYEYCVLDGTVSFGNLFTPPLSGKTTSAGMVLVMMVIGVVIFLALAMYVDLVKPGPYGRAMPWNLYRRKVMTESRSDVSVQGPDTYEGIDPRVPIGLRCVNIVKIYGTFKALNNVNLDVIKNKITVLLGHNGAGKTTLFSILCGMFSPTSGAVHTDEYSVFEGDNLKKFRRVLGYCPQENMVMGELSVQEHLIIFGMLKGLSKSEAREFSDEWTTMFDMYGLRRTRAKKLSGGTKRKLCLAIAMTGKPQYLLLDEPSAGLDIESTRKMWDVLLAQKGKCTIVITTHNMDEADALGDWIAILAHGQMKCLGSSSFLKKSLDSGYHLNCSLTKERNTEQVIKAVNKYIRGAVVLYKTNRSVTFSLPSNQNNNIPDLLMSLEREFGESVSSTLSQSTLDDVFIKVQKETGVKINIEELPISEHDDLNRSCWHCAELLRPRVKWLWPYRMIGLLFLVILLPNLATICGVASVNQFLVPSTKTVDSGESAGSFVLLSNHHDEVSDRLRSTLSQSGIAFKEVSSSLNANMIEMARKNLSEYRSNLIFAYGNADSGQPTAYFKSGKHGGVAEAYSVLINALLQGKSTIVTHTAWFYPDLQTPYSSVQFADSNCSIFGRAFVAGIFFFLVGPFFLMACAYFVIYPHQERTSLFKHLQLMTGLLPVSYWLVNFAFDFLLYIFSCIITVIIFASVSREKDIFLGPSVLNAMVLTLVLFGVSSILLSYFGSFFFPNSAISISVIVLGSLFISFAAALLEVNKVVRFEVSYFIPYPILWNGVHKSLLWSFSKRDCDVCADHFACSYMRKHPVLFTDVKLEFVCFAGLSAVYLMMILLLDQGMGRILRGWFEKMCYGRVKKVPKEELDREVALEKERVGQLRSKDSDEQPELVCDGLAKKYSAKRTAVYDVTFTAELGECFGLVGVNGAGKTTTFGMLTALLAPTRGTAVVEGRWKVTDCSYNYLKRVGYCPQYDGLMKDLPARTIIRLFGRLGGVPKKHIGPLVEKWIEALDMKEIAHRPCGQYSGGNKRKLSLVMALIGNPPVVLLDEPTAGVDPVVRRKIWEILTTSLEQHDRTIILTSHTMSECEAICDRLTIMVKGVMKCLGPIPLLKKAYGKSCILEIKFSPKANIKQQTAVEGRIQSQFEGYATLHEKRPTRLVFLLKTEDIKTYEMFAAMLKIQSEYPAIEDFVLQEAPLEQVFLMFAKTK